MWITLLEICLQKSKWSVYLHRANKTIARFVMKDFSKKVLASLSKKGISIVGSVAVPAFEGDVYFSGVAYQLVWNEIGFIRTYSQVEAIAASSWCPQTYFAEQAAA